jgi:hypothetical protein
MQLNSTTNSVRDNRAMDDVKPPILPFPPSGEGSAASNAIYIDSDSDPDDLYARDPPAHADRKPIWTAERARSSSPMLVDDEEEPEVVPAFTPKHPTPARIGQNARPDSPVIISDYDEDHENDITLLSTPARLGSKSTHARAHDARWNSSRTINSADEDSDDDSPLLPAVVNLSVNPTSLLAPALSNNVDPVPGPRRKQRGLLRHLLSDRRTDRSSDFSEDSADDDSSPPPRHYVPAQSASPPSPQGRLPLNPFSLPPPHASSSRPYVTQQLTGSAAPCRESPRRPPSPASIEKPVACSHGKIIALSKKDYSKGRRILQTVPGLPLVAVTMRGDLQFIDPNPRRWQVSCIAFCLHSYDNASYHTGISLQSSPFLQAHFQEETSAGSRTLSQWGTMQYSVTARTARSGRRARFPSWRLMKWASKRSASDTVPL